MADNTRDLVPLKLFMEAERGKMKGPLLSTIPCLTTNRAISPTASVRRVKKRGYQVQPINQTDLSQLFVLCLLFIRDGDFRGRNMAESFNRKLKAAMMRYRSKRIADQAKYRERGDSEQLKQWLNEFDELALDTDPLEMVQYAIHIEAGFEFGVAQALNPYRSIMRKVDVAVMRILEGLISLVSETLVECLDEDAAKLMSDFQMRTGDERLELKVLEGFEARLSDPLQPQRPVDTHEWDTALEALYENVKMEDDRAGLQSGSGLTHVIRFTKVIEDYISRYPRDAETGDSESLLNLRILESYAECMQQIIRPVSGRPSMKLAETERQIINSYSSYTATKVAVYTVIISPLSVQADLKFAGTTTQGLTEVGVAQNHAIMALVQLQLLVMHSLMGEDESYNLYERIQKINR